MGSDERQIRGSFQFARLVAPWRTAAFGAETPPKVRIAYASRSSSAMPQYMAVQKGYFKAEGLDVEIIQMNPRLGATAVVNGDVSFATPFTSTFRGMLQGFPMKLVFVHLKKGPYYLMVRPEIKDVQQLHGKRIGVATIKGTDQLVAEEMLQAKGFNISQIQAVSIGDGPVRMQALISGAVEAICLAPPHDFMLRKMGYPALLGPPEVGLPSAGMLTSDRLIKENPQVVRRTLKALFVPSVYSRQPPGDDSNADQMAAPAARHRRAFLRRRAQNSQPRRHHDRRGNRNDHRTRRRKKAATR